MKNGLEMVSHDDSVRDDEREQRYDSKERNRYCDMYLFAQFVVGVWSRNGAWDIGFAKGELNVQRRMNPSVPQQRLEMNRICEKVAKRAE